MEVSYLLAFGTGLVSFFAPCIVPLLPAYVSYMTGVSVKELKDRQVSRQRIVINALIFITGFSSVFVLLGTTAARLSLTFHQQRDVIQLLGGILIVVFGLQLANLVKIPLLNREYRLQLPRSFSKLGVLKPFILGIVFASAWSPCVGAVLGTILTLAARTDTVTSGASLLFVYSLGISLPFLITALFLSETTSLLSRHATLLERINKAAGYLLILLGLLLINNYLKIGGDAFTYNHFNAKLFEWAFRLGYKIQ